MHDVRGDIEDILNRLIGLEKIENERDAKKRAPAGKMRSGQPELQKTKTRKAALKRPASK